MVSVQELSAQTTKKIAEEEQKKQIAETKPGLEMLHHIALTHQRRGFTVTLIDGTSYQVASPDFMFTDGMSIVADGHRIYIPKTAIKCIVINNPG